MTDKTIFIINLFNANLKEQLILKNNVRGTFVHTSNSQEFHKVQFSDLTTGRILRYEYGRQNALVFAFIPNQLSKI